MGVEPLVLTLTEKNGFVSQADRFKKRLATEDTSKYKLVRRNDIAFNPYLLWAGAIAQNTVVEAGIISPLYPTFRAHKGFDPRYVARLLLSPQMVAAYDGIAFGSVPRRRRSSVKDFLSLPVPEQPPLYEQRRIAAILDQADALRAKRQQAFAHLDELIRSIFMNMFGDPLSNRHNLRKAAIGTVSTVVTGNSPSRADADNFGDAIEWIKSDNLGGWTATAAQEGLSPRGREKARTAPAGSVLVTCIAGSPNSIGKASLVDREVAFNQQINAILPSPALKTTFLLTQLKAAPALIQGKSTGGMKGLVSKSSFESIEILVPPMERQRQFVDRVAYVMRQRARLESAYHASEILFASLQFRAFRGEF